MSGVGEPFEQVFQRFYVERFDHAVRLARMLTGDPATAEDLAQDAFVRVYRYWQTRSVDQPGALLHTTLANVCRSWHATQRRAQLRMVRHGADPDSLTEWERQLDATLLRLPYEQRAVIVLRYWVGLSEAEIATALGCRAGTVKSRHSRAMHALRKELQ